MAFLKKIFRKKPGGTSFGNILRGASSAASNGMLGQGMKKIELGQTQTNEELARQSGTYVPPSQMVIDLAIAGAATSPEARGMARRAAKTWFQENLALILASVAALGMIIYHFLTKNKFKTKKRF